MEPSFNFGSPFDQSPSDGSPSYAYRVRQAMGLEDDLRLAEKEIKRLNDVIAASVPIADLLGKSVEVIMRDDNVTVGVTGKFVSVFNADKITIKMFVEGKINAKNP